MRIAAELKIGYFPVTPATIDLVASKLRVEDPTNTCVLDPCCGKGAALAQLGGRLGIPQKNLYGVELDGSRASSAGEVLGHVERASFFGVTIVPVQSFSLIWLNPPYDNEPRQGVKQGQQMEVTFLEEATRYLQPGGVLLLHAPTQRLGHYSLRDRLCRHYESVCELRLPKECQPYGESIVFAVRRREELRTATFRDSYPTLEFLRKGDPFDVRATRHRPRSVLKDEPTLAEVEEAVKAAKFWQHYERRPELPPPRPPLPLNAGHLGLVLAGGNLDGPFAPENYEPHVVRGVAYKEEYVSKDEAEENDKKVTHTRVTSQRIRLKVRAITAQGVIHELK